MLCFIIILLSWKAWRDSQKLLSIIGNAYTRPVTVFLCITTQYTDLEPPIQITLNNRQDYTVTHASTFKPERGKCCVWRPFNSVLYILARMSVSISRQSGTRFFGEFISITGSEVHVFAAEGVLAVSLLRQMQKSVLKKLSTYHGIISGGNWYSLEVGLGGLTVISFMPTHVET